MIASVGGDGSAGVPDVADHRRAARGGTPPGASRCGGVADALERDLGDLAAGRARRRRERRGSATPSPAGERRLRPASPGRCRAARGSCSRRTTRPTRSDRAAPWIQTIGGFGSRSTMPDTLKCCGAIVLSTPIVPAREARPVLARHAVAGIVAGRRRGRQHRLDPDVLVLARVPARDVAASGRRSAARSARPPCVSWSIEPLHEVGVRRRRRPCPHRRRSGACRRVACRRTRTARRASAA